MSQPTILKLKVSKTGHASITFRNFSNELQHNYPKKFHGISIAFSFNYDISLDIDVAENRGWAKNWLIISVYPA